MSFNFMAAITIYSDFGAPKIKSDTVSTVSPSISHEVMEPDAMIFVFLMLSRKITLSTKVRLVKAMVFPAVIYGCESCTIKKAKHRRIDALNCGVGEDS